MSLLCIDLQFRAFSTFYLNPLLLLLFPLYSLPIYLFEGVAHASGRVNFLLEYLMKETTKL
jgi:hypothetical protein